MAFNPFHGFRKHNKVVFAGLTILCMVTFILSSGMGRGDFFSQMTDWFTGGVGRTTYLSLYGKNYSGREIDEVNYQRRMANDYMDYAISVARSGLEQRLQSTFDQLPADSKTQFQQLLLTRQIALMVRDVSQIQRAYGGAHFLLQQADAEKKTELANALRTFERLLELDFTVAANRRTGERFFGQSDADKIDDTVNFLVWRHQADQLGVKLADADVGQMIAEETRGELTSQSAEVVDRAMRERFRNGYSIEALYSALRDEFRVRIAQLALTGTAAGVGQHTLTAPPIELTPQESWTLFQDARTTVRVGMIDVPVKKFLAQVKATPSEDELKKLFEKYKNDEPAPDRDLPAFREPRKIGVEWIGADADLPYYQKSADTVLAVAPALRLLADTVAASGMLMPVQLDAEVFAQEEAWRKKQAVWWEPLSTFRPQFHESSLARPETVAALFGAAAGPFAAVAGPLAAEAAAVRREAEVRLKFGVAMIGLANEQPLGVFAAPVAALPQTTLGQARPQLIAKAKVELINGSKEAAPNTQAGLVASDLYAIRGEVMKLGREDKGKEKAETYIAIAVKKRGLEHGRTAEPRDQYHLGDDPALAPLKQAYVVANGKRDLLLRGFGPTFFRDQSQESAGPDGPFIPHKFVMTGLPDEKQYYWWQTEDNPSRAQKYDKARPEVVDAWKLMQARDLAKKEAEKVLEDVRKTPRAVPNLRDVALQDGSLEYFEVGPIAEYMPQLVPTQMGGLSREYASLRPNMTPEQISQAYQIPVEKVPYPDTEMVQQLLNLRKHPPGETAIVSDKPKANYYVATLLQRQEPDQDEFRRAYRGSMTRAAESDSLLARLSIGRAEEFRKAVVEQLRAEAKVVIQESARRGPADQQQ